MLNKITIIIILVIIGDKKNTNLVKGYLKGLEVIEKRLPCKYLFHSMIEWNNNVLIME